MTDPTLLQSAASLEAVLVILCDVHAGLKKNDAAPQLVELAGSLFGAVDALQSAIEAHALPDVDVSADVLRRLKRA